MIYTCSMWMHLSITGPVCLCISDMKEMSNTIQRILISMYFSLMTGIFLWISRHLGNTLSGDLASFM